MAIIDRGKTGFHRKNTPMSLQTVYFHKHKIKVMAVKFLYQKMQ